MLDPIPLVTELLQTADATGVINRLIRQSNDLFNQIALYDQPAFSATAANPAPTTSRVYVMAGLAVSYTVPAPARCMVTITGQIGNTGNANETDVVIAGGHGSPPANGTLLDDANAVLGGPPTRFISGAPGAFSPFSQTVLLENLIPTNTYWIDLAVKVSAGTSILSEINLTGAVLVTGPATTSLVVSPS